MMNKRFRDDDDWNTMDSIADSVADDPIAMLMATPWQELPDPLSDDVSSAVREALEQLDKRDRFLVDAIFVWGKSYSELSDMMGFNSKASSHQAVRTALTKLKEILQQDKRILKLMGEYDDDDDLG
jgi:DNA-directed RNA polymerase specialized sigma24 family protein